jgi:uncharacterized membrane protein YhaH (DUF805 family)
MVNRYHLSVTNNEEDAMNPQQSIQQSITTCFRKYADLADRAAKPELWWFALFTVVVNVVPSVAVGARRLHDICKSDWLQLPWLIPVLGRTTQDTQSNDHGEAVLTC